jgi:hypothetical protein
MKKNTSHPKEPVMYALIETLGVDANYLFQDCVKISNPSISLSEKEKRLYWRIGHILTCRTLSIRF